jgi:hypothetical protein
VQERAESRLQELQRELEGVSLKRRHAVTSIESTISALRNTIDFIHGQESREGNGTAPKVPHARPTVQAAAPESPAGSTGAASPAPAALRVLGTWPAHAAVPPAGEATDAEAHDELAEPLVTAQSAGAPAVDHDEPTEAPREDEESVLVYQSQYRPGAARLA